MLCLGQTPTPPMSNISILYFNNRVHPVHELFIRVEVGQNFVLLPSVVAFNFTLFDAFLGKEFGLIGQASQNHFIASQMSNRVREDVKYFSKYFLDQFVCLIQGHIQRSHEPCSKSAGNSMIFWSQPPTRSMARSIQLRHHSNSPLHRILNQISCFLSSVSFFWRKSSMLGNLRMRVQYQGERIFIDNVPMQHTHLIVHQRIHSLFHNLHRNKMP